MSNQTKSKPKKEKVGRKNAYLTKIEPRLFEIKCWARDGLIDKEMFKRLDVSQATFYKYLKQKEEFREALDITKDVADYRVVDSLHDATQGTIKKVKKNIKVRRIEYNEITGKKVREYDEIVQVEDEVYTPPNVRAMETWLFNRRRADWANRQVVEQETKQVGLTPEERAAEIKRLENKMRKGKK